MPDTTTGGTATVTASGEGQEVKVESRIGRRIDIVGFVAGTVDPVNTHNSAHGASLDYWISDRIVKKEDREKAIKEHREKIVNKEDVALSKDYKDLNLWEGIEKMKKKYSFQEMYIEGGTFFSWSGDNNHDERVKGAERLLNLLTRVYQLDIRHEVALHLIGHSHGGNVINEFTNIIADESYSPRQLEAVAKFPPNWKVKSITYLSTPFFREQHQLNHGKLYDECKIVNVYNEYDLTQRFVADFTLKQLYPLLSFFNAEDFKKPVEDIKSTSEKVYKLLKQIYINDHTEGPLIWSKTVEILYGVSDVLLRIYYVILLGINIKGPLSSQKEDLLNIIESLYDWAISTAGIFRGNSETRWGGYGRDTFLQDLNLAPLITLLNQLFQVQEGPNYNGYLLNLLESMFQINSSGVVDRIDDTTWYPGAQTGDYELIYVNITKYDGYDLQGKKFDYDSFVTGLEDCVRAQRPEMLREILLRLFSQLITPSSIGNVILGVWGLILLAPITHVSALWKLKGYLEIYEGWVITFYKDLEVEDPVGVTTKPKDPTMGSLQYLAMVSHSLSHKTLYDEIERDLKYAFISKSVLKPKDENN